ncbi:hypothetical protein [Roseiarcus sp.]|uniref:hypothetical protein n=1 Tax=Roseiarcus sp. TaxID=1969460 RepID=UPI003F975B5C
MHHNALPRIPRPRAIAGKYWFVSSEADALIRERAGLPPAPVDKNAPVALIKVATLAQRLDVHPKTVKRWVREAYGDPANAEIVEALARRASFGPKRQRTLADV